MATFEVILTQTLAGVDMVNTFHYNNLGVAAGNPDIPGELADKFGSDVLPHIMALQSSLVQNVSVAARDLGNPSTTVTLAAGGGGSKALAAGATMPPHLPLVVRLGVGQWYLVDSSSLYVGTRPGRPGRKYFSGFDETWNLSTGAEVPLGDVADWEDLQDALMAPLTMPTGSIQLNPVVWSPGKAALSSKPARGAMVAIISSVSIGEFTRLASRKD